MSRNDDVARALRDAASQLLTIHGPTGLSVRAVATAAGQTTMAVYSRFGGKAGLLDALYQEGFGVLADAQAAVPESEDPLRDLEKLLMRYRHTALVHAAHYALMFGGKGFTPSDASRQVAWSTFEHLAGRVKRCQDAAQLAPGDPLKIAHAIFALCHGLVAVEMEGMAEGADAYREAVRALLRGFAP
ncbi:MAG: TetR/AcrR family transcriptional regulator [Myxococcota bacterium]